jgi:O-antigen ligase
VPSAARSAVAPLYLFACLILGGSAQGVWQNAFLQLAGIAIIIWAACATPIERLPRAATPLLLLGIAALAFVALQAIPLPPTFWDQGLRARVADGYRLLGKPVPSLTVSLTPYSSVSTLLCLIPPMALFCAMVRLKAYRRSWLAAALLLAAMFGIVLGALQVAAPSSVWYLYTQTNRGQGVGFFANANHMASLLLIGVPFVAALAVAGRNSNLQRYSAMLSILGASALLLVIGIALNGSLAGYGLGIPVIAASALIAVPLRSKWRLWLAGAAALSVLAAIAGLASSSIGATRIGQDAQLSFQSREQILQTTAKAIGDTMPLGSGLGSFLQVYRLYESPDMVTTEYVVHAHNDYVELALELGAPGVLLITLFLIWWLVAAWAVWRRHEGGPFALAASIASATILVHSTVDFPLRTAAISACFAMCLALMADRKVPRPQEAADLRPARHIIIR